MRRISASSTSLLVRSIVQVNVRGAGGLTLSKRERLSEDEDGSVVLEDFNEEEIVF